MTTLGRLAKVVTFRYGMLKFIIHDELNTE